jgi:hypothetical protein
VLFSEMAILYNEDNKRKQLERASRERGGKGEAAAKGKSAAKDASGGRLVDAASGEINTGRIETNTNPLFLNSGGGGDGAKAGGGAGGAGGGFGVDAVMAQRSAPELSQWLLFQSEFAAIASQLEAAKQRENELKRAAAAAVPADDAEDGGRAALVRKQKAEFAPRAAEGAGGSSAIKLLKKKKSGAAI